MTLVSSGERGVGGGAGQLGSAKDVSAVDELVDSPDRRQSEDGGIGDLGGRSGWLDRGVSDEDDIAASELIEWLGAGPYVWQA